MAAGTGARNFLVGLVFLGSLVVLGVSTFALQGLPFLEDSQAVDVRFAEVDSLQLGDDVLVNGYRIGLIDAIQYDPSIADKPILVRVRLKERVNLTEDTKFIIRDSGPLGGRFLSVSLGNGPKVEADYTGFGGEAPGGLFAQLEALIEENQATVTGILSKIREIVSDVREGRGLFGSVVSDEQLRDSFAGGVAEIRETFRRINAGEGPLGALVTDTEMRDRLRAAVDDVATLFANIKEERGVIGMLLSNEKAKEDLVATLEDVRGMANSLRHGDGLIPRLINSKELADKVANTLEAIDEVAQKINNGEGTLGRIVNDAEAWDELVGILALARETLEDLREQAPISTFVNALFATF